MQTFNAVIVVARTAALSLANKRFNSGIMVSGDIIANRPMHYTHTHIQTKRGKKLFHVFQEKKKRERERERENFYHNP